MGTQEGISIVNPSTGSLLNLSQNSTNKKSLSQNSVYTIFRDASNSIWVGTYFGGANLYYSYNTFFSSIQNTDDKNSISNNVVSSIKEDSKHNLWIGTEGGGMNYYNTTTKEIATYKHRPDDSNSLGSNLVKVIFIDKEGSVWSGTHGGGLNVFRPGSKTFGNYVIDSVNRSGNEISSIVEDGAGKLWVASNIGIHIFTKRGIVLTPSSFTSYLAHNTAKFLHKDRYDNIWIAQVLGVNYINNGLRKKVDEKLVVNCFSESGSGQLWMGTNNQGLVWFDYKKNRINTINTPFLKALNIVGIISDEDGSLWLSTDKGLIHFSPQTNKYQVYTQVDGLAGNEFNYNSFLKSSSGYFYFGGFSGITYFFPHQIMTNKAVPSIAFSGLKLHNNYIEINGTDHILHENITLAKPLYFDHDQDVFTVEFAVLSFIKSEKNKFAYKLEGFDKNWNETNAGSATYTNLPSGKYRLFVKGANNDGVWSKPISLLITVRPPFWLSWWAHCLYTLAAAAIIFIVARFFFLRALLKKEEELNQAKLNFFTNASHEIRTHLTLIMAPVELLLSDTQKSSFWTQQLSQVKTNANRLLRLVSELMDFRKAETSHLLLSPKNQNLILFLKNIYESFHELRLSKNINTSFIHEENFIEVNFDENQLEKVFFNLLANAFKFTPNGGTISLFAGIQNNNVIITVTDNGRGIKPEYIDKIFTNFFQVADHGLQNTGYGIGLALSKHIVDLHNGHISVQSRPTKNENRWTTVFTVVLPLISTIDNTANVNQPFVKTTLPAISTQEHSKEKYIVPGFIKHSFKQTILIVEDNDNVRQLIIETLSQHYTLITCSSGVKGLAAAITEIPDIIISDVMMPEMDGYTLCRKIKTDERTSHIPVILLTAKSAQSEHISGLEHGTDIYLTKPFSTKVLTLTVQNLLATREHIRKNATKEIGRLSVTSSLTAGEKKLFSNTIDNEFLEKVLSLIDQHMDDPEFGVEMLSKKVAMSVPVLYKKVRAISDMSVNEFIKLHRFKKAGFLLQRKQLNVAEVCYAIGYDDRKYFSREFKKYFGVLPSDYSSINTIKIPRA